MNANLNTHHEAELDTLLADLGLPNEDEIIEPAEVCETTLEAAVASAEAQEAVNAAYDEQHDAATETVEAAAPVDPMQDPSALLTDAPTAADKPAKGKGKGKPKGEKKAKAEKPEGEAEAPKRKHYASKSERITDKLGASLGDYLVLELGDAALTGDDLAAKQAETMQALKDAGVKVQNRMTFIIEFAAGKSAKLNGIAVTALDLLKKDGKITTGEKGNLLTALSEKYSKNSASAMGNNTVAAMRALKMIVKTDDGYVGNPQSMYLAKIVAMLGA